jgi:16S rRNA (adenine1518-N6/adenine1519-N6)-dimethyltransferase
MKEKPSLLEETKSYLTQHNLRARKGLAQHFLIDKNVLEKIVEAADLRPEDLIMEVGPGLGVLTRELVQRAGWVIAVELDDNLAAMLKDNITPYENISVVHEDILQSDPGELVSNIPLHENIGKRNELQPVDYKVVANLPYYITSAVLRHFLEASVKPQAMIIMVQKEIAQEIAAPPGKMGMLSVSVQFYGRPEIVSYVPAVSFFPPPKVASAVLRIDLYPRPAVEVGDPDDFFMLVKAGFKGARKQLANSLARGLGIEKDAAQSLLDGAGIDSQRRAQTLSLEEWGKLYLVYKKTQKLGLKSEL